jgi:hypothetical protein
VTGVTENANQVIIDESIVEEYFKILRETEKSPKYSRKFIKGSMKIKKCYDMWCEAVRESRISAKKKVKVFESRQSDEDSFTLEFEDMIDNKGNFVFANWSKNIKVGIWIRECFS